MRRINLTAKQWIETQYRINDDGCFIWRGSMQRGIPRAKMPRDKIKKYKFISSQASRSVFALYRPNDFDPDLCVLHTSKCNPKLAYKCVNPNHMYMGTRKQNGIDCTKFGLKPRGEKDGNAILTTKEVKRIKDLYNKGVRICEIMRIFGWYKKGNRYHNVSMSNRIRWAIHGWKHLEKK